MTAGIISLIGSAFTWIADFFTDHWLELLVLGGIVLLWLAMRAFMDRTPRP